MPRRRNFAATLRRTLRPSTMARTFWTFGLNVRLVLPVVFLPTPPFDFARPRSVYWRPARVRLPLRAQTRDMDGPPGGRGTAEGSPVRGGGNIGAGPGKQALQ